MKIAVGICVTIVLCAVMWALQVTGSPLIQKIMWWSMLVFCIASGVVFLSTVRNWWGHYNAAQINRKRGLVRQLPSSFNRWLPCGRHRSRRSAEGD